VCTQLLYTPGTKIRPVPLFLHMPVFKIYSGVNSGHRIGDFCVCEYEAFMCTNVNLYCTYLVAF
jgi:hypothetical protein